MMTTTELSVARRLVERDAEPMSAEDSARYVRNGTYVRLFLVCICIAEIVIVVPNILTEVAIDRGLYAPVLRVVLSVVRLSPLVWPLLGKLGRMGAAIRHLVEVALPTIYGPACGGVEPCRGLATALSGWYLVSTPMHDAFSPATERDLVPEDLRPTTQEPSFDPDLLLPCAVIMSANVGLFLCDALSLTVTPLLRNSENLVSTFNVPRAEAFRLADLHDLDADKFEPTCVICISEFEVGDNLAKLPCGHTFHMECVNEWLRQHGKCPLRCPGLVLPPLTDRSESRESGQDIFERPSSMPALDPWLIGSPMNETPLHLFAERPHLEVLPGFLPGSISEEVDEEAAPSSSGGRGG